jgi:hypothetical protein
MALAPLSLVKSAELQKQIEPLYLEMERLAANPNPSPSELTRLREVSSGISVKLERARMTSANEAPVYARAQELLGRGNTQQADTRMQAAALDFGAGRYEIAQHTAAEVSQMLERGGNTGVPAYLKAQKVLSDSNLALAARKLQEIVARLQALQTWEDLEVVLKLCSAGMDQLSQGQQGTPLYAAFKSISDQLNALLAPEGMSGDEGYLSEAGFQAVGGWEGYREGMAGFNIGKAFKKVGKLGQKYLDVQKKLAPYALAAAATYFGGPAAGMAVLSVSSQLLAKKPKEEAAPEMPVFALAPAQAPAAVPGYYPSQPAGGGIPPSVPAPPPAPPPAPAVLPAAVSAAGMLPAPAGPAIPPTQPPAPPAAPPAPVFAPSGGYVPAPIEAAPRPREAGMGAGTIIAVAAGGLAVLMLATRRTR